MWRSFCRRQANTQQKAPSTKCEDDNRAHRLSAACTILTRPILLRGTARADYLEEVAEINGEGDA
jgi:hypothetical protein